MPQKPNILLITADELRADALGCYGNEVCRTPNIDALAGGGVVFEQSFTPNPICVPARATITTGNYSHKCIGRKDNGGRIGDDQPKIAEHFNAAGYETYACGKLHYDPYSPPGEPRLLHGFKHCDLAESGRVVQQFDPHGEMRGLEDYMDFLADTEYAGYSRAHGIGNNDVRPCPSPLPKELHVDHWVADCTLNRMREHQAQRADQPFMIWCSFPKPHQPLDPPAEYATMYNPLEMPAPVGDPSMLQSRSPYMDRIRHTHGFSRLSPAAHQVIKSYYYGLVSFQDTQIGRVLQYLDEAGLADNTIIIYTADHGDMLGDFGTYFKCSFMEGSLKVPMILRGPSVPAGARRTQLVGLQDILPTLAAMTDCPLDQEVHGLDLQGALDDADAPLRELYYSQCRRKGGQMAMVCDGRWKYCYCEQGPIEELYDLENDPDELVNLACEPGNADLLTEWRDRLIAEARHLGDDELFDGDALCVSPPVDRSDWPKLPFSGLGWRWF